MARNPLASLGAGLARGAGNYSSLMLADRLKREAEERALAGRQTLKAEDFGRQKELLGMSAVREDKRHARTEAANALDLSRRTREDLMDRAGDLGIPPNPAWKESDYRKAIAEKNAAVESAEAVADESKAALDRRAAELRIRKLEIDIANANKDESMPAGIDPQAKDAITARRKRIEMEIDATQGRMDDISGDVKLRNDPEAQKELTELSDYLDELLNKYESAWDDVMLAMYPPPPPPPQPGTEENPLGQALNGALVENRGATGKWD